MKKEDITRNPDSSPSGDISSLGSALKSIISKLREPVFLFALGIIIVLAIVASLSVDALKVFMIPALLLAAFTLSIWLIPKLVNKKENSSGVHVKLKAKNVGNQGKVKGIEGLPMNDTSNLKVDMNVKNIDGEIVGVDGKTQKR